jgi:hypothetical protein
MCIYLFVYLFIYLFIHLFIYLFIYLFMQYHSKTYETQHKRFVIQHTNNQYKKTTEEPDTATTTTFAGDWRGRKRKR